MNVYSEVRRRKFIMVYSYLTKKIRRPGLKNFVVGRENLILTLDDEAMIEKRGRKIYDARLIPFVL